jgi:hypothetical protein
MTGAAVGGEKPLSPAAKANEPSESVAIALTGSCKPEIPLHVRRVWPHALTVEPQDVVLGQGEATDGCLIIDAGMGPMPVVAMQPGRQLAFRSAEFWYACA